MKYILIIIVVISALIASTIWRAFAFIKLWAWFIAPIFNMPSLKMAQGIGVSMLISYATFQYDQYYNEEEKWAGKLTRLITFSALFPATALLFGYITKSFI